MIQLPEGLKQDQIICLMKFGSHLYGTDTPESDTNYMGVYMPTPRQILLRQGPKSYRLKSMKTGEGEKNDKDDVDMTIYSLPKFLELAMSGETVAIDMLHAHLSWLEISSVTWAYLHDNRSKFYTSSLNALVSYSRKQAAKENKVIDWKAWSHALRFSYQVASIMTMGGFEFPLKPAAFLKAVKQGEHEWSHVQEVLEQSISMTEDAAKASDLPKEVDRDLWDDWLYGLLLDEVWGCMSCIANKRNQPIRHHMPEIELP